MCRKICSGLYYSALVRVKNSGTRLNRRPQLRLQNLTDLFFSSLGDKGGVGELEGQLYKVEAEEMRAEPRPGAQLLLITAHAAD